MTSYYALFGRTPELSFSEFSSCFPNAKRIGLQCAVIDEEVDPKALIEKLGGTVKIGLFLGRVKELTSLELAPFIETSGNAITFGISVIGKKHVQLLPILVEIKDMLKPSGISVRFIAPKTGMELSSVVVEKNNVSEILAIEDEDGYIITKTAAVQPFESWNARDYGRPYSDAKLGMLPPKVARMMVNIALSGKTEGKTIADPFCGMGTILTEAMLSGTKALGADISEEVVSKARKNIFWFRQTYPHLPEGNIWVSDATAFSAIAKDTLVDAIVTEPFMGTPKLGEGDVKYEKAKDVMRGLEKLYIGCFRDWHKILVSGGKICITLPSFAFPRSTLIVKKVVDTCEILGYTKLLGPIEYGRPHAVVKRQIYLFQKN